jgi:hypothetical protein
MKSWPLMGLGWGSYCRLRRCRQIGVEPPNYSITNTPAPPDYCGPRIGPMLDFSKNSRIALYAFSICSSVKSP